MTVENSPPERAEGKGPGGLRGAVRNAAVALQDAALGNRGDRQKADARAALARLRRAAGQSPERHPLEFEQVLSSLSADLREGETGHGDAPTPSEQAAFDALTLFAVHAQSITEPIHRDGRSFASAMGLLIDRSSSQSLKPRFDALLAARDHRARTTHLRSLITLLRGEKLAFDYGALAGDLRTLAGQHRQGVLLRWSRDITFAPMREKKTRDSSSTTSES
ncbi:type I-E CRISPR-associated protein Cse2/CasB [Helcobacillus massiliensis]|uniref:type I-E CRISPR-associated protein Cse2/CasB n=1 Tax=Helcobacillus massiliensis TaxID=521392 RepID=UPI0023B7C594|nr:MULTISPECIES: type I-E CRISPR-associated protein Cse2/CasB [Helcobacillus]WOO92692.1 type I-E CRISPR-associated protein Cse2/CasB [Helcobacillus massiliensis]